MKLSRADRAKRLKSVFNAALLLLMILLPLTTHAVTDAERLKQLQNQIKKQEAEIKSLETSKTNIASQISVIQKNQTDIKQAIAITSRQINENKAAITALQSEEKALAEKSKQYEAQAKAGLRFITDNSGNLAARAVLGGGQSDSMQAVAMMEIMNVLNANLSESIGKYAESMADLAKVKKETAAVNARLEQTLTDNKAYEASLKATNDELSRKLTLVKQDTKAQEEYLEMLRAEQKRLDDLIKKQAIKMSSSAFSQNKGKLPFPMAGKVIEPYGEKFIAEAGVKIMHKGIKIQPSAGGDVRPIFDGTVVFVNNLGGVGNVIIIQHDDTYFTVYGNLDEFYVRPSQKVTASSDLGRVNTNVSDRPYLYFEVRRHEAAVNPSEWLSSK